MKLKLQTELFRETAKQIKVLAELVEDEDFHASLTMLEWYLNGAAQEMEYINEHYMNYLN